MKIAHVVHVFWKNAGGSEYIVDKLSDWLARRGHRVTVYTSDLGTTMRRQRFSVVAYPHGEAAVSATLRAIEADDPDIIMIFGENVWPTSVLRGLSKDMLGKTVWIPCYGQTPPSLSFFTGVRPAAIVGVTTREYCTHYVPFGVDLNELGDLPTQPNRILRWLRAEVSNSIRQPFALIPGGYWDHKGIQYLHELHKLVSDAGHAIHFVVCGNAYENKPRDVPWATFLSYVPRSTLNALYSVSYAVISLSSHEGYGLTLLEAAAFGKPALAFNVGAARDMPHVAVCSTMGDMANSLGFLLRHGYSERKRRLAVSFANEHTMERFARHMETLYHGVIHDYNNMRW